MNPRDLNPYLKNNGTGYPEDSDVNARQNQVLFSSLVGDGGASWRLKALKRAQEQAACEGRKLEEVCGIVLGFLFADSSFKLVLCNELTLYRWLKIGGALLESWQFLWHPIEWHQIMLIFMR